MGTKAFLQKGRGKPGLVLPANAVMRINQANDRSALTRMVERQKAMQEQAAKPLPNTTRHEPETFSSIATSAGAHLTTQSAAQVIKTEPERIEAHEPEPEVEPKTDNRFAPLTIVSGIGPTLAERFAAYGFKALADLAAAEPDTINQIPGARNRGRQWVEEARKRLGD